MNNKGNIVITILIGIFVIFIFSLLFIRLQKPDVSSENKMVTIPDQNINKGSDTNTNSDVNGYLDDKIKTKIIEVEMNNTKQVLVFPNFLTRQLHSSYYICKKPLPTEFYKLLKDTELTLRANNDLYFKLAKGNLKCFKEIGPEYYPLRELEECKDVTAKIDNLNTEYFNAYKVAEDYTIESCDLDIELNLWNDFKD